MPHQRIRDCLLSEVPDLDVVVNATREKLVSCFRETNCSDRKIGVDEGNGFFGPRVPNLDDISERNEYDIRQHTPI